MGKKLAAEFLGAFWLVLGGCGCAVLAASYPAVGIGLLGVSLAFGLTVLTMAYAVGHISGGHFNPAVTVGLYAARRVPASDVMPYVVAQVAGAIVGAGVLYLIASGRAGFDAAASGFAANSYGEHSPNASLQSTCGRRPRRLGTNRSLISGGGSELAADPLLHNYPYRTLGVIKRVGCCQASGANSFFSHLPSPVPRPRASCSRASRRGGSGSPSSCFAAARLVHLALTRLPK
jgi:hypothetical protein